jgi:NCS1 family nucleobase:cation symporter-1
VGTKGSGRRCGKAWHSVSVIPVMIVDYYLVRRRTITPDVLRTSGGRYWFRGGWH